MRITTVEFRRLVSTGDYSNMTIGAVAQVDEDETAYAALVAVHGWVDRQIAERTQRDDLTETVAGKRYELERIERELVSARERRDKARAWLEGMGLPLPRGWGDDDMPF